MQVSESNTSLGAVSVESTTSNESLGKQVDAPPQKKIHVLKGKKYRRSKLETGLVLLRGSIDKCNEKLEKLKKKEKLILEALKSEEIWETMEK